MTNIPAGPALRPAHATGLKSYKRHFKQLLSRARTLLDNAQQSNGSFASDDGDPFTLDVTIQAVRALQAASTA